MYSERICKQLRTPAVGSTDLLALRHTLAGLRYVAASPPPEWGGFHPTLVLTAKSALHHIARLRARRRANPELRRGEKD